MGGKRRRRREEVYNSNLKFVSGGREAVDSGSEEPGVDETEKLRDRGWGEWEKHSSGIGGKLLKKMGFKGSGLGKQESGRVNPVVPNKRKRGLGLGYGSDTRPQLKLDPEYPYEEFSVQNIIKKMAEKKAESLKQKKGAQLKLILHSRVKLKGLVNRGDLNGKVGIVTGFFNDKKQRWPVEVEGEILLFREKNLEYHNNEIS